MNQYQWTEWVNANLPRMTHPAQHSLFAALKLGQWVNNYEQARGRGCVRCLSSMNIYGLLVRCSWATKSYQNCSKSVLLNLTRANSGRKMLHGQKPLTLSIMPICDFPWECPGIKSYALQSVKNYFNDKIMRFMIIIYADLFTKSKAKYTFSIELKK